MLGLALVATPTAVAGASGSAYSLLGSQSSTARTAATPGPCADSAYSFIDPQGAAWSSTLRWRFKSSSVPAGLGSSSALAAIKKGFKNIVNARNDCRLPDNVGATQRYLGTTTRSPGISKSGSCTSSDGTSVVAFAPLDNSYAGYTCIWWDTHHHIYEMDMRLDPNQPWATSMASCNGGLMLEAVVTHEAGHAFGLAHVSETSHPRLTMSTYIDGFCENQEATLGWGDLRGLQALY